MSVLLRFINLSRPQLRSLQRERFVGTSTPFSRARLPVSVATPGAVKKNVNVHISKSKTDARGLCDAVHDAKSSRESWELLWAMRDSRSRWSDLRPIADEARGSPPQTLLQRLVVAGFTEPLQTLLEFGVSTHRKDESGKTALHMAVEEGRPDIVQLLLQFGHAQVDSRDAEGKTPLHYAAARNNEKLSKLLMCHGAHPKDEDCTEKTAIQCATDDQILKNMESHVNTTNEALARVGKVVRKKKSMPIGAELSADIVAPKLVMTPVGYCPVDADGKVIQLKRGIRYAKRRQAPSSPNGKVNWYAPRG